MEIIVFSIGKKKLWRIIWRNRHRNIHHFVWALDAIWASACSCISPHDTCKSIWMQPVGMTMLAHSPLIEAFHRKFKRMRIKKYGLVPLGWGHILDIILTFSERRCVESEILPYLQANKLAYSCVMDVQRKHKLPESETINYYSQHSKQH